MAACSSERVKKFNERQKQCGRHPTVVYLCGDAKRVLKSFPRPFSHGVVVERALLNLANDGDVMRRWFPEVASLAVLAE